MKAALVAITGAGGFIGRALTRRLTARHGSLRLHAGPPGAPGPSEAARFAIDDTAAVAAFVAGARCVVHLAGPPDTRAALPARTLREHIAGTAAVLAAAAEAGSSVIYVSSATVHGAGEDTDESPPSAYAAAKRAAEGIVRAYRGLVPSLILRPANVYGPGAHASTLIPELIARALSGEPVVARHPTARIDPIYVDDVAAALEAALAHVGRAPSAAVVEVGSGRHPTAGALAERIAWLSGRTPTAPPPEPDRAPGGSDALPGWAPRVGLDAGLRQTIDAARHEEARA